MGVLSIQVINLKFLDSTKSGFSYLFKSYDEALAPSAVKILEISDKECTFELSWSEDRIIRDVVQKDTIQDLIVSIIRNAKMTYIYSTSVLLSTGLKRQYSKAISLMSPAESKKRPSFSELNLDIRKMLDRFDPKGLIASTASDIVVDELPLESIPSTTLKIKKCNITELQEIVKNTDAKIKKITISPQNAEIDSISITSRGMIKVTSEIDDWVYLHSFINNFLIEIGLMEIR